jgi:hypothetical protein
MGGKRNRSGQHLYLSVACIILGFLAACVPPNQAKECGSIIMTVRPECGRDHLRSVSDFLGRADFDGAMKESQDVVERSPEPPEADAALMTMGLISAHPGNPKKDYKKAIGFFKRLVREFPDSSLAEEAKIWVSVLESFEKAKQVDIEIEQKKKDLGK